MDPVGETLERVRQRKLAATQRLLGDTISLDDDAWQQLTRLPGWTRAHVATHLARNADSFRGVVEEVLVGAPEPMYRPTDKHPGEIEVGSERNGLSLQIDLDTSASALEEAFGQLSAAQWDASVGLGNSRVSVRQLPLARLAEVIVHHVDLDCGFSFDEVDTETARWLLEWIVFRSPDRAEHPPVVLRSASGLQATIGDGSAGMVSGQDAQLLGWLTGRLDADVVEGADGLRVPSFG